MSVLEFGFMQRALVATLLVCVVAPLVGTFVVQRQQSLIGDGMGHVAFAGVGLAYLFGFEPLLGAGGLAVLASYTLYRLQRGGLSGDLSLALIFYGGIAFGFLLLTRSGMGVNSVLVLLFGSPLNLTWGQVAAIAGLCLVVAAAIVALYGPLLATAFDEESARVSGVRTDGLALALTLMVALVVVGGMYVIGILLVAAMMVIPVAAASRVARSYRGTMMLAASIGGSSALGGLLFAYHADFTPGASVVMAAIVWYAAASAVRALNRRGQPASLPG